MITCFLLPSKTGAQKKGLLGRKEVRGAKPGTHVGEGTWKQEKFCICHQHGKGCSIIKCFIDGKDHGYTMRLQIPPQDTLGGKNLESCVPFLHQGRRSECAGHFPVTGFAIRSSSPPGKSRQHQQCYCRAEGTKLPQAPVWPPAPVPTGHVPNTQLSLSQLPHLQRTPDLNPSHTSAPQSPGL